MPDIREMERRRIRERSAAAGTVQAIGSTSKAIDTLASLLAQMTENQASIQANAVVQGEDTAAQVAVDP